MRKVIYASLIMSLVAVLSGCNILIHTEPRFPQLNEYPIAGPERLNQPKWSLDGKYVAFINDDQKAIQVYEIDTRRTSIIRVGAYIRHFAWDPQGHLTYMHYRTDLSGSPFPEVFDLHRVNIDGTNDQVVVNSLYSPSAYVWLLDGQQIVGILSTAASQDGLGDVYLVDSITGRVDRLLSRQELNVKRALELSLSADGETLAIRGIRQVNGDNISVVTIYNLKSDTIVAEVIPRQTFTNLTMGDLSLQWASDSKWILLEGSVPDGKCSKNAVFFLKIENTEDSFCIPTVGDPISSPNLSPDGKHLAFITYVGREYVMLADLTLEYLLKLGR